MVYCLKKKKILAQDSGNPVPNFSSSMNMLKCHIKSDLTSLILFFPHL